MGIIIEFYAVPSSNGLPERDDTRGIFAEVDAIHETGTLVGSVSVNSGAAKELFEWMACTWLAPLLSSKDGGSAIVFEKSADVAFSVDRDAGAPDAPEVAPDVANALSDAVEEAQWRFQAIAVVLS